VPELALPVEAGEVAGFEVDEEGECRTGWIKMGLEAVGEMRGSRYSHRATVKGDTKISSHLAVRAVASCNVSSDVFPLGSGSDISSDHTCT
jgi:hypothetical protein